MNSGRTVFDVIEYGDISSNKDHDLDEALQPSDSSFASLLPSLKSYAWYRFIPSSQLSSLDSIYPDTNGLSGTLSHSDKFTLDAEAIADVLLWCYFENVSAEAAQTPKASLEESETGGSHSCKLIATNFNVVVSAKSLKTTALFASSKSLADSKRIKVI